MIDVSMNLILVLTMLGGITYGLSISSLSQQLITANTGRLFSTMEAFLIANTNLFGTFLASVCLIFITQYFSKWRIMFFGLIASACFNFLLIFASLLPVSAWAFYYSISNFCFNFAIAFYIVPLPIVVAELSDKFNKHRGYFLIMLQLAIALGGFARKGLELFVSIPYANEDVVQTAEIVYVVQFCLSFVFTCLLIGFLSFLHKYLPLEHKMSQPYYALRGETLRNVFYTANFRYPLLLAIAIGPLQQFTGINMMLYNDFSVQDLMRRLTYQEIRENYEYLTYSLKLYEFMGQLFNIAGVAFTIPFVERFGRRTLLLYGSRAINILLVLLGACACAYNIIDYQENPSNGASQIILEVLDALRVLFMFCFEFGPGCMFWVVIGEYFPAEYRTTFAALAFCGNWGTSVLQLGFSALYEYYTWIVYFIDATLLCLWSFVVNRSMPEATGMKLEEIYDQFYDFDEKRLVMV